MTRKIQTYLTLPALVTRMAKMAAAHKGESLSEYIAALIEQDCQESGIAALVVPADKEVRDGE